MTSEIFLQLSLIILVATVLALVVRFLKQPLLIGYIIAGIILGPSVFNVLDHQESFIPFAQVGVAILLFMVGLNLNPKVIKETGLVALVTGIGQIVFTLILGFFIAKFFGFSSVSSLYIALALSFSSTIIIMKVLSDKGDTETVYGKISIGFLIVQDIIAVLVLMIISSTSGQTNLTEIALQKLGLGAILLLAIGLISFFLLPKLTKIIANSQELLLIFSAGWALALASLFDYFGFSIEIGALIAGVTLSMSPYKFEINSKMKPLHDFFHLTFFIVLGSQMVLSDLTNHLLAIILFSLLVLIGNPLIILCLMGIMGYTKRSAFLAGLTVSQISEFSFILIALGISTGNIPSELMSMTILIGLITMGSSAYAIMYGEKLYSIFSSVLSIFEKRGAKKDELMRKTNEKYDVILFGYNRIGYSLVESLKKVKKRFLIIDYNPQTIKMLKKLKIDCLYGDASDLELLSELPVKNASMIISTIPEIDTNRLLIHRVVKENPKITTLVVSHKIDEAFELYKHGATYVITPHFLGGKHVGKLIEQSNMKKEFFQKESKVETNDLKARKAEGHEHPDVEKS